MIRLRTLGSLDLRTAGDAPVQAVLAQPRRTALLAYLALGLPDHRSKDTIYALFWPDHDAAGARHALRQSVYFLRRELGSEALVRRGNLELGMSPERFWCDAVAFRSAVMEGRIEEALGLYRGDLLDGFFATGAPGFERWADEERSRLRELAARAAWRLAASREAGGEAAEAVRAARRALEFAPADEVSFRRLLGLFDRLGDRAGAVRSYEEFAARLREAYDLEPSASTAGALEAIRARTNPAGPARPPPLGPPAPPPTPTAPRLPVAVFPFADPDPGAAGPLAETLAELLSADLKGTWIEPLEPRRVRTAAAVDGAHGHPEVAREVAKGLGAGGFVLGSAIRGDDRLRAVATLFDGAGRELCVADAATEADEDLFDLSAALGRQLLIGYADRYFGLSRGAPRETTSIPAIHHFYEGEFHLAGARVGRAIDAYQRAVVADAGFVPAWARMAYAAAWGFRPDTSKEAGARASALAGRLDEPDASQIEALLLLVEGDPARAEHRFRALLDTYPENADAWAGLGMTQLVTNPMRGRRIGEARPSFERAVSLAPRLLHPLVPLAYIAAVERRPDDFADLACRLGPDHDFAPFMRFTTVFTEGDDDERDEQIAVVRTLPDLVIHEAARYVAHLTPDLDGAIRIARLLTDPARIPEARATGHVLAANLEVARGRRDAARAELDAAHAIDPDMALEQRALLAVHPAWPARARELDGLRTRVERRLSAGPPATPRPRGPLALHDGIRAELWTYLHGLLSARLGHDDAALEAARRLESDTRTGPPGPLFRDLGRGVRSYLAEERGDRHRALDILAGSEPERPMRDLMFQSPFISGFLERFRRGHLLLALGRPDEARPWLEMIGESSIYGRIYAPEARRLLDEAAAGSRVADPRHG
jgi:DNA-binding SARP family transcriptional activator